MIRDYHPNGALRLESELNSAGIPHGVCREYNEHGRLIAESHRENGMFHGRFAQWNDEGKLLGEFEMVKGSGVLRHWLPNGALGTETTYSDGAQHGESKVFDPDSGKVVLRQFYWKGLKVSKRSFVERSMQNQPQGT